MTFQSFGRSAAVICQAVALAAWSASAQAATAPRVRTTPVVVESTPVGATVYVDSVDAAALGVTPITSAKVPNGEHVFIFRLNFHEEIRQTVSLKGKKVTVRATLKPYAALEIVAANEGARGADVKIDGQAVGQLGSLPVKNDKLSPGRHQVSITRAGYTTSEQWLELPAAQLTHMSAMLDKEAAKTGSVLVAADVQGAPIFFDGVAKGTTPSVLEDLPAGTHAIEIRPAGLPVFTQQVLIIAGQRNTVNAVLQTAKPAAPSSGTIVVVTDVKTARIRINADDLAPGIASKDNLAPGNYIVTVTADGYIPFKKEVELKASTTQTVDVVLTKTQGPIGRIDIAANVPGAMAVIDGKEQTLPYVLAQPVSGPHSLVVRAPGFEEISGTCSTAPDTPDAEDCVMRVELKPKMVGFKIIADGDVAPNIMAFANNKELGPVPYQGRLPAGDYIFEVRAEDRETYRQQLRLEPSDQELQIVAKMVDASERMAAGATTHSAIPVPVKHPMIDLSVGWPYLAELRLSIGVHQYFDAGFSVRSFGRLTEFEARVRSGFRPIRQIGLGVQVRGGGGIGPNTSVKRPDYSSFATTDATTGDVTPQAAIRNQDSVPKVDGTSPTFSNSVNSGFASVEGIVSLLLEPIATVSIWVAGDFSSDGYAAHARHAGVYADTNGAGAAVCTESGNDLTCPRQNMMRLRLGGALEFSVSRNWNMWLLFEGIVAQPAEHRRILGGFIFDAPDLRMYPRLGATYKF